MGKRKRRLLKVAAVLGVVLALLGVVAYFAARALIEDATRRALALGIAEMEKRGVRVEAPSFGTAAPDLPRGVVLSGLAGRFRVGGNEALMSAGVGAGEPAFDVRVGTIAIHALDWSMRRFEVRAADVDIVPQAAAGAVAARPELATARLTIRSARLALEVDLRDPEESLRPLMEDLFELLRSGSTGVPLELEGDVAFAWQGQDRRLRLRVADGDGRHAVVVVPEDVRALAGSFERELTEAEIALVAGNPVRTPTLLRLKKDAERTAKEAHAADPTVPEDAYRHVTWSYSLTRAFGPTFAEKVTDAHEVGSTTNTAADHRMDYNNNAVGRRYALAGRQPSELLELVRRSPDVIREPR